MLRGYDCPVPGSLRIVALGGLGEVGKNMMVYEHDRGILVVDGQSGETIYAHNPDHLFFPASTTKLYSCSAALAALAEHAPG